MLTVIDENNPVFHTSRKSIEHIEQYSHRDHIISAYLIDRAEILHRHNTMVTQISIVLC